MARREEERILLKGKTLAEKKKLLEELEMRKQREHEMKFRIERQQLRHDEKFAMQRIEDQDRLEQVLKNVYGTNEQNQSNRFAANQNVSENDFGT